MRKICTILIVISTLLSCAGRKSNTSIKEIKSESTKELKKDTKISTDSVGSKKQKEEDKSNTKAVSSSWKYTAPVRDINDPCANLNFLKPVYFVTASGDSIDITRLPQGSTLESREDRSETDRIFTRSIEEQAKIIKALEEQLAEKTKIKQEEREKIRIVERQTVQWYLVGTALFLGTMLPSLLKFLIVLIKKSIKPL